MMPCLLEKMSFLLNKLIWEKMGVCIISFFIRRCLPLPPSQDWKRCVGWNASQGFFMIRQHGGEAASAAEKGGREVGTWDTSAVATTSKLSQYHTIKLQHRQTFKQVVANCCSQQGSKPTDGQTLLWKSLPPAARQWRGIDSQIPP